MIRVAFLEYETQTKELAFYMSKTFMKYDWTFRHYTRASDLAKAMQEESYQIFVFDEMFKTPRMESVFVHDNMNSTIIYLCENKFKYIKDDERARIIYIEKDRIQEQYEEYENDILKQVSQTDIYRLTYNGVDVNLSYEDIYYMEKIEKMVYFHTKKGEFHQRTNMSDLETLFAPYGFLRVHVSYLVNTKHIVSWHKDEVELFNQKRIPLSRAQKKKILAQRKNEETKEN